MSFLSVHFALFVTLGVLVFHSSSYRWRPHVLLLLSYVFYLTWSAPDALLLLAATVAVYLTARAVDRNRDERSKFRLTMIAVIGLLVVLVGFKCAASIIEAAGGASTPALLLAPLGLSYYLFKLMGYLLDVYWEKLPAERNFVSFALYVAFFPQLVSGPIQRAGDFLVQLHGQAGSDPAAAIAGLRRILFGTFKKVVLADQIAVVVGGTHWRPALFSSLELLVGAYAYALQLYMEFSGITDIAIGLGLLFGLRGPENFQLPFFASSLPDFWRRWHMSLTSWLSDYLFTPLLMSLRNLGTAGLAIAIFVNMLAIGVWHGPKLTYVAFGVINGVFMVMSVITQKRRNKFFRAHPLLMRIRGYAAPLVTFHLMVFAFIVFRANSLTSAFEFIRRLVPGVENAPPAGRLNWALLGIDYKVAVGCCLGIAAVEIVHWVQHDPKWTRRFLGAPRPVRWSLYYAAIILIVIYGNFGNPESIYARF